MDITIKFVSSGCAASHSIAVDDTGRCFAWGRNHVSPCSTRLFPTRRRGSASLQMGQLGMGDNLSYNEPTEVKGLKGKKVTSAACGKNHTVPLPFSHNSRRYLPLPSAI